MDLSDNDLLDLLLRRKEPDGELLRDDVAQVLQTDANAPVTGRQRPVKTRNLKECP